MVLYHLGCVVFNTWKHRSVHSEGNNYDEAEHRGFLGQQNCFVWYFNDGYMSFNSCQNPQNVQYWEWALRWTMVLRWQWCVSAGSLTVTQVALRCGVLVVGRLCGSGAGATWELRALCALFCSEPYNALKVSIFLKRKKTGLFYVKLKWIGVVYHYILWILWN